MENLQSKIASYYHCETSQVSVFAIIYWQPNLSVPWSGYTDIFMARQIGSTGMYNQLASANLNQYSGALPFIYATTHHHVIAYVIGLIEFPLKQCCLIFSK